jgi:hypothetical protein
MKRLERSSCGEWMLAAFRSQGVFSSLASSRMQMLTSINKMFLEQEGTDKKVPYEESGSWQP